jgi:hypothetical protein
MKWQFGWTEMLDHELHYRPDLDGLRGIAVLAVLGFHPFPAYLPGGFVGVDVFLVLSGAAPDTWIQRRVLANRPLVLIGLITYPIYLWHWPILSFAAILGSGVVPVAVRAAAVVLSIDMVSLAGRRYPMMLLARGGCPPMLHVEGHESNKHQASCDETWSAFVSYVRVLGPRVVVLVGGGSGSGENDVSIRQGLTALIASLQETTSVVYLRETPSFDTAPACFLRPVKAPWGTCSPVMARTTVERRMAAYNRAVDGIEPELPGLVVLDSIRALCGSKYCAQKLRSGEILYRDSLHLTRAGGRPLPGAWVPLK